MSTLTVPILQARLTAATEGAREREAAAARERLASVSAELEQVRRSSQVHAHMLAGFHWFCWSRIF